MLPDRRRECMTTDTLLILMVVARVFHALGSTIVAYTASPRETPESRKDQGYIVPGTGDPDGKSH